MDVKEKIIRQSIGCITKSIAKIKCIIYANPLAEICQLRIEAQNILSENKGNYKKIAELLGPLAKKEKQLFALAKKQSKDSCGLMDKQVKLENELSQLKAELYYMERRD